MARECGVALVAYTITHHTRQSAVGLPFIRQRHYGDKDVSATELRYGLEAEYPPFESRNASGELEGFDVELGNAICKAAALKCSWVETSFDALIPGLVAKKFDAINSAMNITEQRRKSIDFTQPIYRIPSQLVGKAGTAW